MDIATIIDYFIRLALVFVPSWVLRRLLVQFFLPPNLDGSEPLDQVVHRMIAYFLPALLSVFTQGMVDTWKPSVFRLTVLALGVMIGKPGQV